MESTPENAARMVAALAEFGFASLGLAEADFLEAGQVIQLGYPPSRIDLILTPKGVDFPTCYNAKVVVDLDGTPLNFIDLSNLIANKQATGRPQDLADVDNLQP